MNKQHRNSSQDWLGGMVYSRVSKVQNENHAKDVGFQHEIANTCHAHIHIHPKRLCRCNKNLSSENSGMGFKLVGARKGDYARRIGRRIRG